MKNYLWMSKEASDDPRSLSSPEDISRAYKTLVAIGALMAYVFLILFLLLLLK